jgi:hypothetical protein
MTEAQRIKNMEIPTGRVDMVLDTDAFNEIDDQFAIAYTLRSAERCNLRQIYAAPFLNKKVSSAEEGMEASYNEILKILDEELPSYKNIAEILDTIGISKDLSAINADTQMVRKTFLATKDVRDKYVLSRLAWDLGVEEELFV